MSPALQHYLLQNRDITHIAIAKHTLLLINSDDRLFQFVTTNGIPSPELFSRRVDQIKDIQKILANTTHE